MRSGNPTLRPFCHLQFLRCHRELGFHHLIRDGPRHKAKCRPRDVAAGLAIHDLLYDSKGREKLESKADLRARGVESPDRADALIGAIVLAQEFQIDWREVIEDQKRIKRLMQYGGLFPGRHIEWRWLT